MPQTYKIAGWDKHFENSRSRVISDIDWVPVPNKHDGEGFMTIMHHKKGMIIYAAWHLILQVASKCTPRGTLVKGDGSPHTAGSIATKTSSKPSDIQLALDFLASPDVGWLAIDGECHPPVTCPSPARHLPVTQPSLNRREGKGREGNTTTPSETPKDFTAAAKAAGNGPFHTFLNGVFKDYLKLEPGSDDPKAKNALSAAYRRFGRAGRDIIAFAHEDPVLARRGFDSIARYMERRELSWNIETVAKRFSEWKANPKEFEAVR